MPPPKRHTTASAAVTRIALSWRRREDEAVGKSSHGFILLAQKSVARPNWMIFYRV